LAQNITDKTLIDLEFSTVLETVEEYCISDLGRQMVQHIRPINRSLELKSELNQVNEYLSSFANENRIPNHYFEEISKEISLLGIADSFLEGTSFIKISSMSENVNDLLLFFKKFKEYYPTLFSQSEDIEFNKLLSGQIKSLISPFGEVVDNASVTLQNIRKDINKIRGQLGGSFNKAMANYASQGYLDDIRESVIDNQRVLAVQAMYRKRVNGAIMGNSRTGSIVYIAPEATLNFQENFRTLNTRSKRKL